MADLSARMMSLDKTTRGLELMSLQAIYPDEFEAVNDDYDAAASGAEASASTPAPDAVDIRSFRLRVRPEIQLDMNFAEVDLLIALRYSSSNPHKHTHTQAQRNRCSVATLRPSGTAHVSGVFISRHIHVHPRA